MPGPSNPDNVPSDSPTEKYRTSTGNPVRKDFRPTFGAEKGAIFPNADISIGAVGTPINRG
jgi:hypothetical protein